ncbi:MAG: type IA DNA topoisomerase [Candidatus Bathyarchaeia archaeon]|nr:type IA DNA topoisomerase [Candidatus Bathyarchaeota archaeon]
MLVIAEKPSVAKNIRLAIKPTPPVIALKGHILELDFTEEYSRWRSVDPRELFHAPVRWVIRDPETYKELFRAVRDAEMLVLATDNDPEGELIAYEALLVAKDSLGDTPRYCRMRFNTVTLSELRHSWENLEPDLKWNWVWKALLRHKFDLITGAAYTRLLTLSGKLNSGDGIVSWGSCQMPTLWFIYQREMEIRRFKPEKYYVLSALLDVHGVKVKVSSEPIKDAGKAREIYATAKTAKYALATGFQLQDEVESKPLPTDTDSMLQELSKITGLSAAKIMALAESLYGDGYISYPRTETNMWLAVDHRSILTMLSQTPLGRHINMLNYSPRSGRKNDGAHPPIYPTAYYMWPDDKGKVWEYIARRYLANVVGKDALLKRWRLQVSISGLKLDSTGRYFVDEGFYQIFPYFKPKDTLKIAQINIGEKLPIIEVKLEEKKTKPPPRLTESELLRLLEQHSIGTDATRADYPQIILERGYAEKKHKSFRLSALGEALINLLRDVDERLVTPDTRRYVEQLMAEVEMGKFSVESALKEAVKIYEGLFEKVSIKLKTMENAVNKRDQSPINSKKT